MNNYIDCGNRAGPKCEQHLVAGNDSPFFVGDFTPPGTLLKVSNWHDAFIDILNLNDS